MSFGSTIRSYVYGLLRRNKTVRDIWRLVKGHSRYRTTTNKNIQNAIDKSKAALDIGKKANKAKANERIGRRQPRGTTKPTRFQEVSYTFTFSFPNATSHRKEGLGKVDQSIEVPTGLTKKEIIDLIMAQIKDWIDNYYQHGDLRAIRASIIIRSISEV